MVDGVVRKKGGPVSDDPFAQLDPYERRYLAVHLLAAGHEGDLDRLLVMERVDGHNAWFARRDADDDVEGYARDVALARGAAREPALGYGYALVTASINAVSRDIPSALRVALVRHGRWPPSRALADAGRLGPGERAQALVDLVPHLPAAEARSALG